jgi:CBS domain-containing protein
MGKRPVIDLASLRKLRLQRETLKGVESFPYSEDLASVMVSPVYTCRPEQNIREVVREMAMRGISSAVVVDGDGAPVGILTERDVMKRIVAADGLDVDRTPVLSVMTPEPVVLGPEDSVFKALSVLSVRGIKHLPLVREGHVAGIVTMRQLLKLRHPEPTMLINRVLEAHDIGALRLVREEMPQVAASKLATGIRAYDIVVMLSLINQDVHRKVLEFALEEVGDPPVPFCLFLTGSHGRMENLLSTDQDHGMIIADSGIRHDEYFMDLARAFSEMLVEAGYETCPGYVMSVNPTWRKSLSEWKLQLRYWFDRQVVNLARYVTVFFDAVPVYGDYRLFKDLDAFAHSLLGKHYEVLRVLHEEEGRHRPPTGLLGRFITEKTGEHRGELDVKRSGLIFVVEGIRILALRHGIRETSTINRITALVDGGFINAGDGEYFEAAYRFLLHYALNSQVEKALSGRAPDTYIDPSRLSPRDREMLRHAFRAVSSLQGLVASEFGELTL